MSEKNAKQVRQLFKRYKVKFTAAVLAELCKSPFKVRCRLAWRLIFKKFKVK